MPKIHAFGWKKVKKISNWFLNWILHCETGAKSGIWFYLLDDPISGDSNYTNVYTVNMVLFEP